VTTFSVAPDHADTPTLWRAKSEHDQYPEAIARLAAGGDTLTGEDRGVVFRAAAAVLAPDEAVHAVIVAATFDPGRYVKREREPVRGGHGPYELLHRWQARAVAAALRAHVEERP
jgi:hypothetical protein